MRWELDHVFLATTDAASCESALSGWGLTFDHHVIHDGQGTANACAFFDNAYVEILRAENVADLRSDVVRPLCLEERIRWRETGACPFGVCLRPTESQSTSEFPMPVWQYEARNRPVSESIPIVTPRNSAEEPMVFLSRHSNPKWKRNDRGVLTSVRIRRPAGLPLSEGIERCCDGNFFSVRDGDEYLMELEWNDGRLGKAQLFVPEFPILLRR